MNRALFGVVCGLLVSGCGSKPKPDAAAPDTTANVPEPAPGSTEVAPDPEPPPSPDAPPSDGVGPPPSGDAACGGYAGKQCPEGFTCVDDPNDGCDPTRGGRDCGGLCRAGSGSTGGGAACGKATCKQGEVCCNASCGVCTPPGGVCTQQFCQ
jgi:hypothetical protein